MGLELIIGLGIVGGLLAYLFFRMSEKELYDKHFLLRLLLLGCLFGVFILVGKVGLDSMTQCTVEVSNSTVDGGVTSFEYEQFCFETPETTGLTFYKLTLWIVRLISAYILVYLFYEIFLWLRDLIKGIRGRSKK